MTPPFAIRLTPDAATTVNALRSSATQAAEARRRRGRSKASPQEGLYKQVAKTLELLAANPRHPGLQTHEFHSLENPIEPGAKVFSAYAQNRTPGAYRVFSCYGPGVAVITVLAITPHP